MQIIQKTSTFWLTHFVILAPSLILSVGFPPDHKSSRIEELPGNRDITNPVSLGALERILQRLQTIPGVFSSRETHNLPKQDRQDTHSLEDCSGILGGGTKDDTDPRTDGVLSGVDPVHKSPIPSITGNFQKLLEISLNTSSDNLQNLFADHALDLTSRKKAVNARDQNTVKYLLWNPTLEIEQLASQSLNRSGTADANLNRTTDTANAPYVTGVTTGEVYDGTMVFEKLENSTDRTLLIEDLNQVPRIVIRATLDLDPSPTVSDFSPPEPNSKTDALRDVRSIGSYRIGKEDTTEADFALTESITEMTGSDTSADTTTEVTTTDESTETTTVDTTTEESTKTTREVTTAEESTETTTGVATPEGLTETTTEGTTVKESTVTTTGLTATETSTETSAEVMSPQEFGETTTEVRTPKKLTETEEYLLSTVDDEPTKVTAHSNGETTRGSESEVTALDAENASKAPTESTQEASREELNSSNNPPTIHNTTTAESSFQTPTEPQDIAVTGRMIRFITSSGSSTTTPEITTEEPRASFGEPTQGQSTRLSSAKPEILSGSEVSRSFPTTSALSETTTKHSLLQFFPIPPRSSVTSQSESTLATSPAPIQNRAEESEITRVAVQIQLIEEAPEAESPDQAFIIEVVPVTEI